MLSRKSLGEKEKKMSLTCLPLFLRSVKTSGLEQ